MVSGCPTHSRRSNEWDERPPPGSMYLPLRIVILSAAKDLWSAIRKDRCSHDNSWVYGLRRSRRPAQKAKEPGKDFSLPDSLNTLYAHEPAKSQKRPHLDLPPNQPAAPISSPSWGLTTISRIEKVHHFRCKQPYRHLLRCATGMRYTPPPVTNHRRHFDAIARTSIGTRHSGHRF